MQIAKLAAERDLPELNFRAVREALRAGPPVVPTNPNAERRAMRHGPARDRRGLERPGLTRAWSPTWSSSSGSGRSITRRPTGVYEVLRGAVLPPGRPAEVFLYAPPPNPRALLRIAERRRRCWPPGRSAPARSTT